MQIQSRIVQGLLRPDAYDYDPGTIETIQTHISYVFLTRKFVYKVKKNVNFGFLDFSTLDKRRFYCEKELQLNRRLCGDMYIEVAPITLHENNVKIKGSGEVVDYALKMKRMPQERIMTRLLEDNHVDRDLVDRIAKIIADFHSKAETSREISEVGSSATVKLNWKENFEQTQNVVDKTISKEDFKIIEKEIGEFFNSKTSLLEMRKENGKIRDCHGDIHSGNIFVTDRIYIFDAIEFNERFRYSDVAADMAFLAMDLDFKGRRELSDYFVKQYQKYSGDEELQMLLEFYKCYRAYVRGKVVGFRLSDPNIGAKEKEAASKEAKAYFKLAASYAAKLRAQ